jgi:lytic murein transglycosylase
VPFAEWLAAQRAAAAALGISSATYDRETAGLTPDLVLPDLVIHGHAPPPGSGEPEFLLTAEAYLAAAEITTLGERGRTLTPEHHDALALIEKRYGVPGHVVVAIWGRETAYGRARLSYDALRAVATEAYAGRRQEEFQGEFLATLKILDAGDAPREGMKSSWAGAMGPTQLMPSNYLKYGADGDGDNKADIWTSVPDALASTASLLVGYGWKAGSRWGYEVKLPAGFDCTQAISSNAKPGTEWLVAGLVPLGAPIAAAEQNELFSVDMPAGPYGPALLISHNFAALEKYGGAELYALFVAHLSDRIDGGVPFVTPWQRLEAFRTSDVRKLQAALAKQGFYTGTVDGLSGPETRAAIGAYQKSNGLAPDCTPTTALFKRLGRDE